MEPLPQNDFGFDIPFDIESLDIYLHQLNNTTLPNDNNEQQSITTITTPPPQPQPQPIIKTPTHTPNLSSSTSSLKMRTQMKQELMRNKALEEEKREKNNEKIRMIKNSIPLSFNNQPIQQQQSNQSHFNSTQLPPQLLKVSKLENPTPYHFKVTQERQYREFINANSVGGSVPPLVGGGLFVEVGASSAPPNLQLHPPSYTPTPPPTSYSSLASLPSSATNTPEFGPDIINTILDLEAESSELADGLKTLNLPSSRNKNQQYPSQIAKDKERLRKNNHNQVEKKRRSTINKWIQDIGTLLPSEGEPHHREIGDFRNYKGDVLKAAVTYIKILKDENKELDHEVHEKEAQTKELLLTIKKYEDLLIRNKIIEEKDLIWKKLSLDKLINSPPKVKEENLLVEMDDDDFVLGVEGLVVDPMLPQPFDHENMDLF